MSESKKGIKFTKQRRDNISKASKGRRKKITPEWRRNIRGRVEKDERRPPKNLISKPERK